MIEKPKSGGGSVWWYHCISRCSEQLKGLSYVLCSRERKHPEWPNIFPNVAQISGGGVGVGVGSSWASELLLVSSWWRSGEGGGRGQGAVIILVTLTRESHSHTSTRSTEVLSFDINMLPHHSLWLLMLFCWRSLRFCCILLKYLEILAKEMPKVSMSKQRNSTAGHTGTISGAARVETQWDRSALLLVLLME